jgi:hypothetical protein
MSMAGVFKVVEYVVDPSHKGVGRVPEGKVIKEFSGRDAMAKANALRDKLNERVLKKANIEEQIKSYFVKGDLAIPSVRV